MPHRIRPASRADAAFLREMAIDAANWHPARVRPRSDLLADPAITRHVRGWKRPGDGGVIAVDPAGTEIGACWFRVLARDEPGVAFVGPGVPELTLGVRSVWRAQGIGRELLVAACDLARSRGHQRISLAVDRANFAARLYRSEGFVVLEAAGDDDVMVKTLR